MPQSLRIAYAGTPEFAVPALNAIENSHHEVVVVLTQPDRKSGRGRKIRKSPVKLAITSENVQVLQPEDVNQPNTLDVLRRCELDLIVVAAYGQIFSKTLLELPRLGCINIHASLLPRWRGASPIQHAILAGDIETGVTIMQMVPKMDAGDIWQQSACSIEATDTAQILHDKLAKMGADIVLPTIETILNEKTKPLAQSNELVTYCKKLTKSDGLIDWHEPADIIMRKIRAYHPWPGAYSYLNGRRIRITAAKIGVASDESGLPGSISRISKQGFSVVAGNRSCVSIEQLVPEGGKQVSAADFCNSNDLRQQQFSQTI